MSYCGLTAALKSSRAAAARADLEQRNHWLQSTLIEAASWRRAGIRNWRRCTPANWNAESQPCHPGGGAQTRHLLLASTKAGRASSCGRCRPRTERRRKGRRKSKPPKKEKP